MENTHTTQDAIAPQQMESPAHSKLGLLVADLTMRRLLQGVAAHLDMHVEILEAQSDIEQHLSEYEMIVADTDVARAMRPVIKAGQSEAVEIKPALIAVASSPAAPDSEDAEAFDAVLHVPERPSVLSAQLGVALYAHRAFARRYQSAMEELNLNRNIFRSLTNGISVANAQLPDMPLMYVNPAFEVMSGYSLEEVEGRNCRFLQNDDRNQPGLTLIREALLQQRETTAVLRNFRKDGTSFWNELTLSPIRNRDGIVTHFVGVQNDVTERVEFEIALRESEKLAAVGRLASSIAHEINNPLEAVMNLLYLAQQTLPEKDDTDESRRYMGQADLEVQRIKLIAAQSLRFYKQSTGPEAVLCSALLDSILDIYTSRFVNFNIAVLKRERSTQHIVCLASEIRQVVSNLVTNAVDAMSAHGGTLLVRSREGTDWKSGRSGVVITIADTGTGIPRSFLASIYKAFYTTKGDSGTGLGLWVSSEIVKRHRGHLRVRSSQAEPMHGTVFQLFLPFQGVSGDA